MSWLDLHMHSNISNDGEFSPKELMTLCSKANLKVAALTDHNSIRGVEEAKYYAKKLNFKVISAIELDCTYNNVDLHLLGYDIELNDTFLQIEKSVEKQEQAASLKRLKLIDELGIFFNYDEAMDLSINGVITGEMIAEAALNDNRNKNNPLMSEFYPGGSRSDNPYVNFYWDYCSMGKPAYVPMKFITLQEAVDIIKKSSGLPVLAHPGNNIGTDKTLFQGIINTGVLGVEVYSSYHDAETTLFYENQARDNKLITTVGSDFHGKTKPSIKLGSVSCNNLESNIYNNVLNKKIIF